MAGLLSLMMAKSLQEQQQAAAQRQQAELLKPLLNQFGPDTAKQVGSALLSDSPQARQIGGVLLQQLLAQRGQIATPTPEEVQERKIGVINPSDYTPESVADFAQTGDYRKLQVIPRGDPYAQQRLALMIAAEDRKRAAAGRLPVGQLESMIQEESVAAGYEAAQDTMRPEYFGFGAVTLADAASEFKARFGTEEDQPFVQFWNELDSQQAERRHALFGATLTEGEQIAWNKIAIRPTDSFPTARAKLEAQQRMIARKSRLRRERLEGAGYAVPGNVPPPPPGFELRGY